MKVHSIIAVLVIFCFLVINISSTDSNVEEEKKVNEETTSLPQQINDVDLNRTFYWADERIPTENQDIRERLERELTANSYFHSNTILNIKKSGKYFPIMETILAQEGVPDDFKYLAVAESDLRNVTSHAGARGIWQIMKAVGKSFGLEINGQVDERYHIEKATRAACKLLKKYKQRFGTWTDAAAAYNFGETRFARDKDTQRATSFYDMNLGSETNRYLFRLVAIKDIFQDPQRYGFMIEPHEKYPRFGYYYEVQVDKTIPNLGDFAVQHGITYRTLKVYNPWLISSKLTVSSGKKYLLKIPRKM